MDPQRTVVSLETEWSALEYSQRIIEFDLCAPSQTNKRLIAECITSISKGRSWTLEKAYRYLARAISLAKGQGIEVDRKFFLEWKYMNIRPPKEDYVVTTQKRDEACAEHGCMSGWVYADKGVVRCQKCVRK